MRSPDPVLALKHLTKQYGRGPRANDDISLSVGSGEVFGLLGPNGAGKTTLVSQVLGLVAPSGGEILLDGVDATSQPALAREFCSYQPQSSVPIDGLTALEAIEIVGRIRGGRKSEVRGRARELTAALDLEEWESSVIPLSGGVARLVAFCMAVVVPGRIVILDEPTNDVDPLRRKKLWALVRTVADSGSAVLLVTHNVLEAERCVDRLAIMDRGRVTALGTPGALKAQAGVAGLRLELTLDGTETGRPLPSFLSRAAITGRRLVAEVQPGSVAAAVDWAGQMTAEGWAEEFSLSPANLEDVFSNSVSASAPPASVAS